MIIIDGKEATKTQYVAIMVSLGMSPEYAKFSYALATGETKGDVIELSEPEKPANGRHPD